MARNPEEIIADLAHTFASFTGKVTYFGEDGIIRNIFGANASNIADIEYDIARIKRDSMISTARGTGLDTLASERYGITRKGPAKSSAIVIIKGPVGTVVPINTAFYHNVTNEKYLSINEVTIGTENDGGDLFYPGLGNTDLAGQDESMTFGHYVLVESVNSGSKTKASPKSITVTTNKALTVWNSGPSTGGEDTETDEELRTRLYGANYKETTYTDKFFEAIAIEAEDTIQKAVAEYSTADGLKIHICNRSGCQYPSGTLTTVKNYVEKRIPAFFQVLRNTPSMPVEVVNVDYTDLTIEFRGKFRPDPTLFDTYITIIDQIGDIYINPGILDFGESVTDDMVARAILDTGLAIDLELDSIKFKTLIQPGGVSKVTPIFSSICRIARVKMTDTLTSEVIDFSLNSSSNP